ncbi:nuclear transport factor 2 family protein [Rhodococcus opacus]|uniref:nuclear transport factor 2 family protein n=1 Tax=Rhodococcus opacus TaxID=37919 RepID=UPI00146B6A5C|nr:nuclear transport factor 2 family protein [Rhodococcus opacus]MDV7088964.1 nuclear transport factor 2 family protein [Rhodococcus opacus]WKN60250.1 nuclear transport factor 2 family protein [Rhodococcus opacus]
MRANKATIDLLTEYYSAMATNDPSRYGAYYAEDMTLTFGNSPEVKGRENVLASFDILNRVRSNRHEFLGVWEEEGGLIILECVSIWELHNGSSVAFNALTLITMADGKFTDQRIYADIAPLLDALDRE